MNEELLKDITALWNKDCTVLGIEPITPDASSRRYYRLHLNLAPKSIVAMVFDGTKPAEIGGQVQVPADEAYVLLTGFLANHSVAVPKLLHDVRAKSVLLIEDVGNQHLADVLTHRDVLSCYKKAIDQLINFHKIEIEPKFFACARSFTKEVYLKEMQEFIDYVFPLEEKKSLLKTYFDTVASELLAMPVVFSHRDYHSWNLILDENQNIRVIDFQDALLAPRAYDLASLLNDRDSDSMLGKENYSASYDYFKTSSQLLNDFDAEYLKVLLQRDLKVAGRFHKLAGAGKQQYLRWVPGTLKRIGRTLAQLSIMEVPDSVYSGLLKLTSQAIPEIKQGAADAC